MLSTTALKPRVFGNVVGMSARTRARDLRAASSRLTDLLMDDDALEGKDIARELFGLFDDWDLEVEVKLVVLIDTTSVRVVEVGSGAEDRVYVPASKITALISASTRELFVVHNHPSGSKDPSDQDLETFREWRHEMRRHGIAYDDLIVWTRSKTAGVTSIDEYLRTHFPRRRH